ncbi:MAG: formylglycine-generating enzyme family protein, partial [Planctomycetes bacterium]|nr:formylglycine-generating enzyme family protein [Planctomycetota bacterium]
MPPTPTNPFAPAFALSLLAAAIPAQKPGEGGFVAYRQAIGDSGVGFDLAPVPGGRYLMGSPAGEKERKDDEGPPVEVEVAPFWMGVHEVTWAEYDLWNTDASRPMEKKPDGVARPT